MFLPPFRMVAVLWASCWAITFLIIGDDTPIRHALRPSQQVIGRYTHLSTSILSLHPSAPHFSHACSTFHHFNHHPNPSSISTDMFASPLFSSTSALSYLPYFTLHALTCIMQPTDLVLLFSCCVRVTSTCVYLLLALSRLFSPLHFTFSLYL